MDEAEALSNRPINLVHTTRKVHSIDPNQHAHRWPHVLHHWLRILSLLRRQRHTFLHSRSDGRRQDAGLMARFLAIADEG
jgi:hypothetical protein